MIGGATEGEEILFGLLGGAAVIGVSVLLTHGPWTLPTCNAYDPVGGRCVSNLPCGQGEIYDVCAHRCVSGTLPLPSPLACSLACGAGTWCDPCSGACEPIPRCSSGFAFAAGTGLCVLAL